MFLSLEALRILPAATRSMAYRRSRVFLEFVPRKLRRWSLGSSARRAIPGQWGSPAADRPENRRPAERNLNFPGHLVQRWEAFRLHCRCLSSRRPHLALVRPRVAIVIAYARIRCVSLLVVSMDLRKVWQVHPQSFARPWAGQQWSSSYSLFYARQVRRDRQRACDQRAVNWQIVFFFRRKSRLIES